VFGEAKVPAQKAQTGGWRGTEGARDLWMWSGGSTPVPLLPLKIPVTHD